MERRNQDIVVSPNFKTSVNEFSKSTIAAKQNSDPYYLDPHFQFPGIIFDNQGSIQTIIQRNYSGVEDSSADINQTKQQLISHDTTPLQYAEIQDVFPQIIKIQKISGDVAPSLQHSAVPSPRAAQLPKRAKRPHKQPPSIECKE